VGSEQLVSKGYKQHHQGYAHLHVLCCMNGSLQQHCIRYAWLQALTQHCAQVLLL
jgi:hypothetical protein